MSDSIDESSDSSCVTADEICDTATGELSDTDSTRTAFEFWDARKLKFALITDEDGRVMANVTGQSPITWTFKVRHGELIVEHYAERMLALVYGRPKDPDVEWMLRAQVRIWSATTDMREHNRVVDADIFEFGDKKDPLQIKLKYPDITRVRLDMRYVYEIIQKKGSKLEDLDNVLAIQPSLTATELLEKFYWSQRYNLPNLRRCSLLRAESSCRHLIQEMKGLPEYQELSDVLRQAIEQRHKEGWTNVRERMCYWEAASNVKREIALNNEGLIMGGPYADSESSLATTFGMNSEEILGTEKPIEILNRSGHQSEYIIVP